MLHARMIGYRVGKFAQENNVSIMELSQLLKCSEAKIKAFLKGRAFVSFEQLSLIANKLNVTLDSLLSGYENEYNECVVHCMNKFENPDNREKILDIVDEYMDLLDSVSN